jgi:UPF0755 protein
MSDTSPTEPPEFGRRADQPQEPIVPKTASEALQPQAAPPPPPRSRRSRGSRSQLVVFLNFLMTIVVVAVIGAFVALYIGRRDFDGPGPTTAATTFLVKPGQGTGQIAAGLEDAGIVSDAVIFQLGYRAYGGPETMKAGEYEITPGMSMRQVMQLLQSGKSIMYSLTIPDGLTVVQAF